MHIEKLCYAVRIFRRCVLHALVILSSPSRFVRVLPTNQTFLEQYSTNSALVERRKGLPASTTIFVTNSYLQAKHKSKLNENFELNNKRPGCNCTLKSDVKFLRNPGAFMAVPPPWFQHIQQGAGTQGRVVEPAAVAEIIV